MYVCLILHRINDLFTCLVSDRASCWNWVVRLGYQSKGDFFFVFLFCFCTDKPNHCANLTVQSAKCPIKWESVSTLSCDRWVFAPKFVAPWLGAKTMKLQVFFWTHIMLISCIWHFDGCKCVIVWSTHGNSMVIFVCLRLFLLCLC